MERFSTVPTRNTYLAMTMLAAIPLPLQHLDPKGRGPRLETARSPTCRAYYDEVSDVSRGNWDNMLRGPQHIIIIPTLVVATITQCGATSRSDAYLPLCIPTPYGLIFGGCGDHLS